MERSKQERARVRPSVRSSAERPTRSGRTVARVALTPSPRASQRSRRDGGASLVEFALIVPLLTLFLFGIVQFGLAYDKKQSINSAAREGARTAAIPVNDADTVVAAVEGSFQALGEGGVTTKISVDGTTYSGSQKPCKDHTGKTVVVEASVKHVLTIPFFGAPKLTLSGKGEFRCELEL